MTTEDARAAVTSEDARGRVHGMLLCAREFRGVCSRHGNFHGARVKDSLGCHM